MARRSRATSQRGEQVADEAKQRAAAFVEMVVNLYRDGWFPMGEEGNDDDARWVAPHARGVMPMDSGFHISRSLRRTFSQRKFVLTVDSDFSGVLAGCAAPRVQDTGKWLNSYVMGTMRLMHSFGHAHSIEAFAVEPSHISAPHSARAPGELVGGIYGVSIGRIFFAESMFCSPQRGGTNSSKAALVAMVALLTSLNYAHLDIQMLNDHTQKFGGYEVPHAQFVKVLAAHRDNAPAHWPTPGTNITELVASFVMSRKVI
jgi:leucyl/phenylalanyl-tRNA--protein transferase